MQSIKKALGGKGHSHEHRQSASNGRSHSEDASPLSQSPMSTDEHHRPTTGRKSLGEAGAVAGVAGGDLDHPQISARSRGHAGQESMPGEYKHGQTGAHAHGHGHSHGASSPPSDLSTGPVIQTTQHLAEVKDETHHVHNIEEVERKRSLETHQHHVQVHHQPLYTETHEAERVHQKAYEPTRIQETHASTDQDAAMLKAIAASHGHHAGEVKVAPTEHTIVDKGEKVSESVVHHVHNIIVPLLHVDSHEHHRTKTTVPIHHIVHDAPIVHEAVQLEPMSKEEYLKRGGVLGSTIKSVDQADVLSTGKCERKVEGVAEQLEKDLHLKPGPTAISNA